MTKSLEKLTTETENHLKVLGYSKATYSEVYNNLIEFSNHFKTHYGISNLKAVNKSLVSDYIEFLKQRDNRRTKGRKLSSVHINGHIYSLKKLSEYMWKTYQVTIPMAHIQRLKESKKEKEYLSKAEVKRIYEATHATNRQGMRDRAMLAVFYGCGLRRTEGEALKLKDIDFKAGFIHVRHGKGRKERLVPMSATINIHLKEYVQYGRKLFLKGNSREQFLFLNERGKHIGSQSLLNSLKKLLEKAVVTKSIGLHSLRHSIATHLLENEVELEYISTFLGHSSLESTQIYTHINEREK